MKKPRIQQDSKILAVAVHMGNILRIIASRYPRLHDVVLEIIQNALDASAKRIDVVVNLERRQVSAFDNGFGVNEDEFQEALTSIGQSIKPGKFRHGQFRMLGQFGLGLVAPIGKCRTYRFISHSAKPGKRTDYIEYNFDAVSMESSKEIDGISGVSRPDIDNDFAKGRTWWNTYVNLKDLIADETITGVKFDDLARDIMDRYGEALRQGGVDLTLKFIGRDGKAQEAKIDPPEFSGDELEEVILSGKDCGQVSLKLFLLPQPVAKTKARLLFCVPQSDFRLPWRQICRQALRILSEEDKIFDVFNSGLFEGVVSIEKCQITFERDGFNATNALVDFFIQLEDWAREHGLKYVESVNAQQRDNRFQEIGKQAVADLERYLDSNPTAFSTPLNFLRGAISGGHTDMPGRKTPTEGTVMGTGKHHEGGGEEDDEQNSGEGNKRGEQKKRRHITVGGPGGTGRVIVKGQSGFTLIIEAIRDSVERYIVEEEKGIIRVNSRHPDFSRVNKKATQSYLKQYLYYIMLVVLSKYCVPELNRTGIEIFEDHFIPALSSHIIEHPTRGKRTAAEEAE